MENVVSLQYLSGVYRGKKVLVTGHTGFKGLWLTLWLHQLGAIVKGYALAPESENEFYSQVSGKGICENVIADIRDKNRFKKELLSFKPDFVFHLAAQSLVRKSYQFPAETFEINAVGTANVLEAVTDLDNKCSVVIITTDKVYENKELDVLYNETDELGGYDPYSASKACTELVVSSFKRSFFNNQDINRHGKGIATARAGNVIGGGDYSTDRIIPDIIKSLKRNVIVEVRNPNAIRPWQHVLEPLAGYLALGALLEKEPVSYSQAFNFGPEPSDHLTVETLVETAIAEWGTGQWTSPENAMNPHEAGILKLDISKAKKMLEWAPKLNATQALKWTMDWYKKPASEAAEFSIVQIKNYMQI